MTPKPRRSRERIFREQHAEEATEEAGGLGALGYGLTGEEEARDLRWAWNLDAMEQRQLGPTERQRVALMLRYYAVFGLGAKVVLRRLVRPASYEEVGFFMGISKQAAHRLIRDGAAAAGVNLSDLDGE